MPVESLHDLFVEELRDMYDGEKRLLRALPKMAKAASDEDLEKAFSSHLRETERQVRRLEQVFRTVSQKPRGKKCDGIMGIVEEGNKAMEELDEGPVLDAALIAGAQKVEHYEIASYGTLAYFAELLGNDRAKDLLGETLDEEKAADEKLTQIAKSEVNREALTGESVDTQDDGGFLGLRKTAHRAATAVGLANETQRRRSRAGQRAGSRRGNTRSRSAKKR
jgi:ferritin-like metal-binding protein YciE